MGLERGRGGSRLCRSCLGGRFLRISSGTPEYSYLRDWIRTPTSHTLLVLCASRACSVVINRLDGVSASYSEREALRGLPLESSNPSRSAPIELRPEAGAKICSAQINLGCTCAALCRPPIVPDLNTLYEFRDMGLDFRSFEWPDRLVRPASRLQIVLTCFYAHTKHLSLRHVGSSHDGKWSARLDLCQ